MKNLLILLTIFTLVFQSCDNDDDPIEDVIVSPLAGNWSGTYDGDDSGTWTMEISDTGEWLKGTSFSNNSQQFVKSISLTNNADGTSTGVSENGTISTNTTSGTSITGTWYNPNFIKANGEPISGTLEGSKD